MAGQPRGDPADAGDVGVAIGPGVAEVRGQHGRIVVTVEDLDRDAVGPEARGERGGDRRLPGARQPGEPQRGSGGPSAVGRGLDRVRGRSHGHGCPLRRRPARRGAGSRRTGVGSAGQPVAQRTRDDPGRAISRGAGRSVGQTRRADDALQIDVQPCDQADRGHGTIWSHSADAHTNNYGRGD